ncbi:hypothetical protein [Tsukamurella tyrosinosolvens]|uniref:hypothetical protein n=1 Tax=Tsukamurella tyrosinosolvens TaxID=57704 RepID=UPI000C7E98C1|nr:hypothetical protein [Tsukamurella tyrosinosolvens]
MTETFEALTSAERGTFTCWTIGGEQVVLVLRDSGVTAVRHAGSGAVRHAGSGAVLPADGVVRAVAEVTAWPRVGKRMQLRFTDGEALATTEVRRIARFEAPTAARTRVDQQRGCDVESRAQLYRVVQAAPQLIAAVEALSTEAAARIGLTPEKLRELELMFSRSLWSSTADLHQQGRSEYAQQVVARARGGAADGITELRLVTNSLDVSERFWRAIYADAAVQRVGGELRVTPATGPALLLVEALAAHLITTVDMEIVVDDDAADRLRANGFDVSRDGRYVVDVNGTDATVRMEVLP